ncbi:Farnesyl-diphosphate farnesyltransferase, partial [Kappamyces sp. JEL0680]
VLRGLDTIEDDMTIDIREKVELLRRFHELTMQDGWNFHGNGPDEKDALLLQEYEVVVKELKTLKPEYVKTIVDITKRMGNGMADFSEGKKVVTMEDYNLYTHYVAGLVGLGLTGLFLDSGLEDRLSGPDTATLANDMGLFLQKVNILKDFLTDAKGPIALARPENKDRALACLNELCADALALVPSCLEYLSRLSNPSVFHFAAIPQ